MKKIFSEDDAVVGDGKGEKIARGSGRGLGRQFYPLPLPAHRSLWHPSLPLDFQTSKPPDL